MMSGSGTSIFAMGPPAPSAAAGGSSSSSFDPDAFAEEMGVSVWAAHFTGRPEGDATAWYPNPNRAHEQRRPWNGDRVDGSMM